MTAENQFPKRIWLQSEEGEHPDSDTYHGEGMTWCEDKINSGDAEYIRVDLVNEKTLSITQQVFTELDNEYPYKKAGDRESYTEYREGFSDGIDLMKSRIESKLKGGEG